MLQIETDPARALGNVLQIETDPTRASGNVLQIETDPAMALGSVLQIETDPARALGSVLQIEIDPARASGNVLQIETDPARTSGSVLQIETNPARASGSVLQIETDPARVSGSVFQIETNPSRASGSVLQIDTCYNDGLQKVVDPPPPAALLEREESTAQVPPRIPGTVVTKPSASASGRAMASELQASLSNNVDYACAGDATQQSEGQDRERVRNKDPYIGIHGTQPPTGLLGTLHSPLPTQEQRLSSDYSMQCLDTMSGSQPSKGHLKVNSTAKGGNIPNIEVTRASMGSSDRAMASELQASLSNNVDYACAGDATRQSDGQDKERKHSMQAKNKDSFIGILGTQPLPTDLSGALQHRLPSDNSMQCMSGSQPSKGHLEVDSTEEGGNVYVMPATGTHTSSDSLLASANDVHNASHNERLFSLTKEEVSNRVENGLRANPGFHDHNPTGSGPIAPTSRKVFHKLLHSSAVDGGVSTTTTATLCDEPSGANTGWFKSNMLMN